MLNQKHSYEFRRITENIINLSELKWRTCTHTHNNSAGVFEMHAYHSHVTCSMNFRLKFNPQYLDNAYECRQKKQQQQQHITGWMKNSKWISMKNKIHMPSKTKPEKKNLWIAICALSKNNTWSDLLVKDMKRAHSAHTHKTLWLFIPSILSDSLGCIARVLLYYDGYDT